MVQIIRLYRICLDHAVKSKQSVPWWERNTTSFIMISIIWHSSDGTVTTSFETTPSISPYLIAFAVTARVLATASIYNETKLPLVESEKAVKVLEKTLQVPFMLPKLDLIFFRHTRGLASMGNWGLVTIETLFIFQDNEGSENSHLTLLSIVVGELCQQWFANMVSPKWWSQIWVQLSLSTYYEFVVINSVRDIFQLK